MKNKKIGNCFFVKIKGKVWKGKGSSALWMPEYFDNLYPGTLNLKLLEPKPQFNYSLQIQTKFGLCYLKECIIADIPALIIQPPNGVKRLNHIEIASVYHLRNYLQLQDKNIIEIKFIM